MAQLAAKLPTASLPLPVGSPGKVGFLDMAFAVVKGRTRLVAHRHQVPFQVMRAMHYDGAEPTMAYTTVVTPTGGILQGDRLALRARIGEGAVVHVTTAAATNLHTMEMDYGGVTEEMVVEEGGYLEYLPDPIIPHRDTCYVQTSRLVAHERSTLIYGETLLPGRIHMGGEIFQYGSLAVTLRGERPDGRLLFADRLWLEPERMALTSTGRLGGYLIMSNLYILCPPERQAGVQRALRELAPPEKRKAVVGISQLPHESGLLVRGLVADTVTAAALMTAWWGVARQQLRGTPIPEVRKY